MEIAEKSRQKELESAQEKNTMGNPTISTTKDFSSEKQIAKSIQMEESTNPRANLSSAGTNSPEIAYGGQMLHEEYALLSSQTKLGQQMSYTALMQQVIQSQSPKINLHTNQGRLAEMNYHLQSPIGYSNSMILTTNRCIDNFDQAVLEAKQEVQVQITSTENSTLEQVNGAVQAGIASTEDNAEMTDKENKESAADEEEADNDEIDSRHIPCEGMQFKTDDEAYTFFNFYAYLIGFSIVIAHSLKTSDKKRNNEVIKYTYKCNRHGKNQDNATNQVQKKKGTRNTNVLLRTDCKCVMVVRENNGIWSVIRLDLNHNHNLCLPEERKFL
ncbi:hypothetical protein OsI_26302 [Oryza sativa Indica Group]|uniref:FAR1 domain-containing protein n=1 Tax=Oryza sativa subsp. indica TaxID=39946 RepID=A2YM49_ORYSI|nr:hypothetical protein OsI_26302 [Oryza sativa Indica Group]